MGPDFRPDYLDLGKIKEKLNNPTTLALTATATNQTLDEIAKSLRISGNVKIVQRSVNRKNIFLSVKKVDNETEKEDMLIKLLDEVKAPGIVYFSSKKKANTILEKIKTKTSLQVAAYHADMDKSERYIIQQQYINNQIDVICATSAFGMGINKKNIRYVIHYHMPSDIESYVQEIGRAGRDGKQSLAILLYANGDEMLQRRILDNTIPQPNEINFYFQNEQKIKNVDFPIYELIGKMKKNFKDTLAMSEFFEKRKKSKIIQIQKMKAYIETNSCKREFLLEYFDELIPSNFHNEKCCIQNTEEIPLEKLNLKSNDKKEEVESDINYLKIINKIF
ncbi:helicase-related protein [Ligilactobacillus hayakitensis]|uniref:helicase-related protein n=1 Tax=Ligilactobacillus hayakitensis TaxID=396716 RepID=UPI001CDB225D|nr:helicase-related protein [Ligilactobacillus hayakitensis]